MIPGTSLRLQVLSVSGYFIIKIVLVAGAPPILPGLLPSHDYNWLGQRLYNCMAWPIITLSIYKPSRPLDRLASGVG